MWLAFKKERATYSYRNADTIPFDLKSLISLRYVSAAFSYSPIALNKSAFRRVFLMVNLTPFPSLY